MTSSRNLRDLLEAGSVRAASCFDALSARIAELAGFQAIHLTGFGVEATQIGAPDMGLISLGELANHAGRIAQAVSAPVLADIDTGFGGANNVTRTIRTMEASGVAGVHIEDQVFPKRCPTLDGRVVVSREESVARVQTAVEARSDADFVIVARSDADTESIDAVIERCNLYLAAGADMAMPTFLNVDGTSYFSLSPDEQMEVFVRLNEGIDGKVMSLGVEPPKGYTIADMEKTGFAFTMCVGPPIAAVANALSDVFHEMQTAGTDAGYFDRNPGKYQDTVEIMRALKLEEFIQADERYARVLGEPLARTRRHP